MGIIKRNLIQVSIVVLVSSLAGLSSIYNYQQFITYGYMPLLFIIGIIINKYRFYSFNNFYTKLFLGFLILGFILLSISINITVAFDNIIKLVGVYLSILIIVELLSFKKYNFAITFLISYVIAFLILATLLLIGVRERGIELSANWIDRTQFDLNANVYSYFSFFANFALFYLIYITEKRAFKIASILCIILGVYISFYTASRSGVLFTLVIGFIYWVFIYRATIKKVIIRLFYCLIIFSLISSFIMDLYNESYLKQRVDQSVQSGDSRETLALEAINVFVNNPFTGVGPGQYSLYSFNQHSFSHNSYTEIAANMGIIGLLILIILLVKPLWKEIKRLKASNDKPFTLLNILFFSSFILINNIYVFYLTTYGMMFFFMVLIIQKKYYKVLLPINEKTI